MNLLLKIINIKIFLLAFLVGLVYMYFYNDKTDIFVYPTPHNSNKIEYHDRANNCFGYKLQEVKCPSKKKDIKNIPIQ